MNTKLATQRQLKVTEVLDLHLLPDEGLRYDEALDAGWLEEKLQELGDGTTAAVHAGGEGWAKIEVEPLAPVSTRPPIRVHGEISAPLVTTCGRCLQPVEEKVEASLDLTLFAREQVEPEGAKKVAGTDDELSPGQLDEGTYQENLIDLPDLVREALILEIGMNPRCADEEACSDRTDALIKAANQEAESVVDDRWAALRRLRDGEGKPS